MLRRGIVAAGVFGFPWGRGTGSSSSAGISSRSASERRTTILNRRSPSNTRPASVPPIAVAMRYCTAARLRPRRAISPLSILISRKGRPEVSSVFTLSAPSIFRMTSAIWPAVFCICLKSSPNTFTARSSRTPAMSSLKRISIGCEKPTLLPGSFAVTASIFLIRSSLVAEGSGHCS